jgi:hypothetical protein
MDEATMFAVALMNEAQARTRRSDDWEQDIERLQQLAVDAERREATRGALNWIAKLFRRAPASHLAHA